MAAVGRRSCGHTETAEGQSGLLTAELLNNLRSRFNLSRHLIAPPIPDPPPTVPDCPSVVRLTKLGSLVEPLLPLLPLLLPPPPLLFSCWEMCLCLCLCSLSACSLALRRGTLASDGARACKRNVNKAVEE